MKILVFAHYLEVGGTQVNAIDLSTALRDRHGHDVVLFATPGPMVDVLKSKGLRYIPAPMPKCIPSPAMMTALSRAIRQERPDVVHVWDWWQCAHAVHAAYLRHRLPMVVTDMLSVGGIEQVLPKSPLTTFGTPERVDMAKAEGREHSRLLLPPVDVHQNHIDIVDAGAFREQVGLRADDIAIATVSRLDQFLKLDSLRRTVESVGRLGHELPLRLIIVGDGDARADIQSLADKTNAKLNREAVTLAGQLLDPRPAYAGADIIVGMGGSALRGMALSRPVVVVGGDGFADTFRPESADHFLYYGLYGVGDGDPDNAALIGALRNLATAAPERRSALGAFSRKFVEDNFSLEAVSSQLNDYCVEAASRGVNPRAALSDSLRTAALLAARSGMPDSIRNLSVVRKVGRSLGMIASDSK